MVKNLEILIFESFFLSLACLEIAKQSIDSHISFFPTIIDLELVLIELIYLADLTITEIFCIYELIEVIIVSKDKDLVFAIFQVVGPRLKSLNNSPELLIMYFIYHLYVNHFSKKNDD